MLAVQGPSAISKFCAVRPACAALVQSLSIFQGLPCCTADGPDGWFVARTGYTGEDGLEIMLPAADAAALAGPARCRRAPCGLGARDTLRMEAGMNLYGHDMDSPSAR